MEKPKQMLENSETNESLTKEQQALLEQKKQIIQEQQKLEHLQNKRPKENPPVLSIILLFFGFLIVFLWQEKQLLAKKVLHLEKKINAISKTPAKKLKSPPQKSKKTSSSINKKAKLYNFLFLGTKKYSAGGQSHTVEEYRHKKTEIEFVLIPGGSFIMGCSEGASDEKPLHKVTLSPFLISKYEITQKVYKTFMGNNPSRFKGSRRPVENVSWEEAQKFCLTTGLSLPTEAQWEYAAKAGTTGKFYWGKDNITDYCWYHNNSGGKTHVVGTRKPNAFGLCDMSGNVWEWCADWYDSKYYNSSPKINPRGPATGSTRVNRGSSWSYYFVRSAARYSSLPGNRGSYLGFRVCGNLK